MLPASAVPAIVSVVSFERPLFATRPVTGATSSVTLPITGASGAVVSMVTWNAVEAATLVARRIARLGRQRMGALAQHRGRDRERTRRVATPVPSTVVPSVSYSVTVLPASAVPPTVSVVSFELPLSATAPVTGATSSVTLTITGAAGAERVDGDVERRRGRTLVARRVRRPQRQCMGRPRSAPKW